MMEWICTCRKDFEPKTDFQYSCLNFITLQNVVEKITGQSLRDFARENIFGPLQMNHTDYLPCAPDANGVWKNTADPVWASLMPGQDWRSIVAPTTKQEDGSVLFHARSLDDVPYYMLKSIQEISFIPTLRTYAKVEPHDANGKPLGALEPDYGEVLWSRPGVNGWDCDDTVAEFPQYALVLKVK